MLITIVGFIVLLVLVILAIKIANYAYGTSGPETALNIIVVTNAILASLLFAYLWANYRGLC